MTGWGVLRVGAFVLVALLAFVGLVVGWFAIVLASGGAATECGDRGDCGTLGEFTWDTMPLMLILWIVGAFVVAWFVVHPRRRP